jgi:hypothetical protein
MIGFIDDYCGPHGVEPICRVWPIAPSAYHERVARRQDPAHQSPGARQDLALKPKIARVFADNFATYGMRKALGTDDAGVLCRRALYRGTADVRDGLRRGNRG